MLRHKNKFYEPTKRQQEDEKLGDIYKMINMQQENMAQLLAKYQDKDQGNQRDSRSIQTASIHSFSPNGNKNRLSTRIEHLTLQLPIIGPNKKNPRKQSLKRSRQKIINDNPYLFQVKDAKEKQKLKVHLDKAYKIDKIKRSRSKGRLQKSQRISAKSKDEMVNKLTEAEKIKSDRYIQAERERLDSIKEGNNSLPTPIGYFKDNIDPDSSSDEGQVPLTYYERQYRTMIRSQALQETNFLYFSKNESMKQWTEALLLLFEKHDKELQSLRKKCKYLEKFDDNFFTIDIFKQ